MQHSVIAQHCLASPLGGAVRPAAASGRSGLLAVSSAHPLPCSASSATFFRGRPATALNQFSLAEKKASLRVAVLVSQLGLGSARQAVAHGHQPNPSVNRTSNIRLRLLSAAGYLKR